MQKVTISVDVGPNILPISTRVPRDAKWLNVGKRGQRWTAYYEASNFDDVRDVTINSLLGIIDDKAEYIGMADINDNGVDDLIYMIPHD